MLRILNVDDVIARVDRYGGGVAVVIWPAGVSAMYVPKVAPVAPIIVLPVVPVVIGWNVQESSHVNLDGLHVSGRVGLKRCLV